MKSPATYASGWRSIRAEYLRGALLTLLLTLSVGVQAAPKADLWPRWQAHDAASTRQVDHGVWDRFLQQQVIVGADGIHRIAYGKVPAAQRTALKAYLVALQAERVRSLSRAEQRAYWINLYNAATVDIVLAHYPVDSILKISISPGLFVRGPWGAKRLRVENEALSLDDIEHRILRPIWKDPRTHYAVNCASLGCPNLATRAYTAATMESLLDQGAREFINHSRGAQVRDGRLTVSSIYRWFAEDFGNTDAGVLAHLRRYADPALTQSLRGITRIDDAAYDWTLNDAR